jgi:adenylate cyclase
MYLGHSEVAIAHFERSLRLSPLDPIKFNAYVGTGTAHAVAGRYDEAVTWVEKALRERPDAVWAYRTLASVYANAGRLEDARQAVATLLRTYPGVTISKCLELIPAHPDYLSRFAEGLRKAGLPE